MINILKLFNILEEKDIEKIRIPRCNYIDLLVIISIMKIYIDGIKLVEIGYIV